MRETKESTRRTKQECFSNFLHCAKRLKDNNSDGHTGIVMKWET